jgi:hypothetical protein
VVVPTWLARQTLDQFIGKPLNVDTGLDEHNQRRTMGHISTAWIKGNALKVSGVLYDRNFKELSGLGARQSELGMSYELAACEVRDVHAPLWELTSLQ